MFMRRKSSLAWLLLVLFILSSLLTACGSGEATKVPESIAKKGYARPEMLVDATQLKDLIGKKDVVVLDVRDPKVYILGHIKGALNIWRPDYTAGATKDVVPGRDLTGMLADQKKFEETMGKLGITENTRVIVYDDKGLYDAARLWWALYIYGHKNMQVLDGGYEVWKDVGGATELGTAPSVTPATYKAQAPNKTPIATLDDVKAAVKDGKTVIVDAREEDEFLGDKLLSGAYRKGRIPGAKFINWKDNLSGGKTIKSAEELKKMYAAAGITKDTAVISYCQSGVRSANTWFVLRLIGYDNAKNFDGSWIEWSIYDELPVESGK